MNSIKIIASGKYLPEIKIENEELNKKFKLEENWIEKRTGIKNRFYAKEEIEELAINAVKDLEKSSKYKMKNVEMIIVATTSTSKLMPGISFEVQNYFDIENCICIDILAGCSGFINAFDIARNYIALGKVKNALVIGVEKLSNYINEDDVNTKIILGDGAGAILIEECQGKKYDSLIECNTKNNEILTCHNNESLYMNGKEIYKFAITEPVNNIEKLLEKNKMNLKDISYIIPHQSNVRILERICEKLNFEKEKMIQNLEEVGNTFCASIPIAINEMMKNKKLISGNYIILLGYGGGLNIGSILIEV